MIELTVGSTGSYKTYDKVKNEITDAMKQGRKVVHNIAGIKRLAFAQKFGEHVLELLEYREFTKDPDTWRDPWTDPETGAAALIVVDECHKLLKKGKYDSDLFEFLAEHRHEGYDIILITQGDTGVESEIRKLCSTMAIMSSGEYAGFKSDGALANYNRVRWRLELGQKEVQLSNDVCRVDHEVYEFYDSRSKSDMKGANTARAGVKPIWKRPRVFLSLSLLILCPVVLWYNPPWKLFDNILGTGQDASAAATGLDPSDSIKNAMGGGNVSPASRLGTGSRIVLAGVSEDRYAVMKSGMVWYETDPSYRPLDGRCAAMIHAIEVLCGEVVPEAPIPAPAPGAEEAAPSSSAAPAAPGAEEEGVATAGD